MHVHTHARAHTQRLTSTQHGPCLMTRVHYCLGRVPQRKFGWQQEWHRVQQWKVYTGWSWEPVCVCALNKSNLLWFMARLVCMHLWYTSSLHTQSKIWRRRANGFWQLEHSFLGQSHCAPPLAEPPASVGSACLAHLLAKLLVTELNTPKAELWTPEPNKCQDTAASLHRETMGEGKHLIILKRTDTSMYEWAMYCFFYFCYKWRTFLLDQYIS